MFVRFRQTRDRLQVSFVVPHRFAGKVRQEHIAGLGSVRMPPTVADRLVFWRKVEERLAKLGNRINAEDAARIRGSLFARIPMPSADEQAAVQLANAQADAELFVALHDMHATVVADHQRFAGTVDSKIAEGCAVLAEAAARLSATRERVAAIERGEAVAASPSLVRCEIISRSCSATAARMWIVSLVACGLSTATNSTRDSIKADRNATLRESRSSLATTSLHFSLRQSASASASLGRLSLRLPLSTSTNSLRSFQEPPLR
jgi:hypothetical protein